MERVPDDADEPYLADGERTEERLGSVDYDVWRCVVCGHHEAVPWPAFFTAYSRCDACGRRTLKQEETVLTPATRTSTGLLRVTRTCEHCGAASTADRVLPVLVASSSSGGRARGSGSSGRSSFGGGSAGGGGASRRY